MVINGSKHYSCSGKKIQCSVPNNQPFHNEFTFVFNNHIFLKLYKLQSIGTVSRTSQRLSSLNLPELNLWVAVKNMKGSGEIEKKACPFSQKNKIPSKSVATSDILIFRDLKKK